MFTKRSLASAFVLGGGLAYGLSLSSQCQSTLLTVAASPDSTCLNIQGLAGLLTTSANSSLVPTINTWLSGFCSSSPCSNSSLQAVVQNITSGCGNDLSSLGISNSSETSQEITQSVEEIYPTVRDIGCLKISSNNTFCVTDLLNDIEAVEGTLSADNIISMLPTLLTGQVADLPDYVTCNDCVKKAFNVLQQDQPSLANQTVSDALSSQCGSNFLSSSATGVAEGTGTAAPNGSSSSGALSGLSIVTGNAFVGLAVSSLIAVSSGFLVLA